MAGVGDLNNVSRHLTYSKSNVPLFGALFDYIETSLEYLRQKTFTRAERLHVKASRASLSATFIATVCLLLGLVSNVKFEVMTFEDEPLANDLHFILMSKDDKLYIDDIDVSRVVWCVEASDALVILFSTLLIWNSSFARSPLSEYLYLPWRGATLRGLLLRQTPTAAALLYTMAVINGNVNPLFLTDYQDPKPTPFTLAQRSPLSEYLYLPWLGATLRGLLLRQTPTAAALIYTMAVINGNVNPLFLTAFTFLFLLEARLWLEIARLVRMRWERRDDLDVSQHSYEVQTLWSNDDVQSVEVGNYFY